MIPKSLLLLLSALASLSYASPTANPGADADAVAAVEKRDTGVWLDLYHAGDCKSGWEPQDKSGWVWDGRCKNFDSFTYGAKVGDGDWSDCILKFWENPDCNGRATTHHVWDGARPKLGAPTSYPCFATANIGKEFYLQNGAASVQLIC
ncbi:uncharacterized protein ACLA_094780 [Aspergillus clavatus NRRL 1]|uniref:Secreted protein n=1 Tax=Aspergillus clavatus (strain ATCC 1007 / CBS 513.65 / DSM 816 / NCTC 3887 / NRRL 1 / QM 1276 / 107) TaxID=344612 RepID=A1CFX8_ASPCL|nr:uncharacterized protein ACLA_094780 [Aspergillus clavatus NRRL 1]EAW11777.1 hypothetical protein ACLA_094780 [Aspergillus clavatus NRRL 1]